MRRVSFVKYLMYAKYIDWLRSKSALDLYDRLKSTPGLKQIAERTVLPFTDSLFQNLSPYGRMCRMLHLDPENLKLVHCGCLLGIADAASIVAVFLQHSDLVDAMFKDDATRRVFLANCAAFDDSPNRQQSLWGSSGHAGRGVNMAARASDFWSWVQLVRLYDQKKLNCQACPIDEDGLEILEILRQKVEQLRSCLRDNKIEPVKEEAEVQEMYKGEQRAHGELEEILLHCALAYSSSLPDSHISMCRFTHGSDVVTPNGLSIKQTSLLTFRGHELSSAKSFVPYGDSGMSKPKHRQPYQSMAGKGLMLYAHSRNHADEVIGAAFIPPYFAFLFGHRQEQMKSNHEGRASHPTTMQMKVGPHDAFNACEKQEIEQKDRSPFSLDVPVFVHQTFGLSHRGLALIFHDAIKRVFEQCERFLIPPPALATIVTDRIANQIKWHCQSASSNPFMMVDLDKLKKAFGKSDLTDDWIVRPRGTGHCMKEALEN